MSSVGRPTSRHVGGHVFEAVRDGDGKRSRRRSRGRLRSFRWLTRLPRWLSRLFAAGLRGFGGPPISRLGGQGARVGAKARQLHEGRQNDQDEEQIS
ncbi:MAG: hypothetical protein M3358_05285 [Actinomycetota bacterium]|nr:hypothetical protein [Actinomycetota bacterium]